MAVVWKLFTDDPAESLVNVFVWW